MPYCVNCGVELESVQKRCPLCNVEVYRPPVPEAEPAPSSFAQARDEQKKTDRSFWIKFNSVIAAVPIAVCILTNYLHDKALTWSWLVIVGVYMLWFLSTSPFFFKRLHYIKVLLADFVAVIFGLGMLQIVLPYHPWFFSLALPITLFCLVYWLGVIALVKARFLRGLRIGAALFVFAMLLVILIDILLDLYAGNPVELVWCWFAAAPCFAMAALLVLLDSNEQVRSELAKRFHI